MRADAMHAAQQSLGRQEQIVGEIMRLDARQPERRAVLRERTDRFRARQQRAARAFVDRPGARRGQVHRGVRIGQAPQIAAQQVAALVLRQEAGERGVRVGEYRCETVQEPVHLGRRGPGTRRAARSRRPARDAPAHRPAPGSSPRSRRTAASARCQDAGAASRCRTPGPAWCCPRSPPSGRERPAPR